MNYEKAKKEWDRWSLYELKDPELKEEMEQIQNCREEIYDHFYRELKFGTGGMRGKLGVGPNRMNIYTVAKTTQGYAEYLKKAGGGKQVAIAYDSRKKSLLFAQIAAEVLARDGIKVWMYKQEMPTPILSFTVRYLRCDGGIVITASHNPAEYNGYKIYDKDGGQIPERVAEEIHKEIQKVDLFHVDLSYDLQSFMDENRITLIPDHVTEQYLQQVTKECFQPENMKKTLRIVYTPLNGTGLEWVTKALYENGYGDVGIVEEQREADGNFVTCPYPNPEVPETFALAMQYAKKTSADLVLATDPDCDRIGAAVLDRQEYICLNGNETGLLLFDYICRERKEKKLMPTEPLMMKTIVTSSLADKIAAKNGVQVIDVLTGFKNIGQELTRLDSIGQAERFIFGMEESHGYLTGTYIRDKDGVNGALMLCDMCQSYKQKGMNLIEALGQMYQRYGYCVDYSKSYSFEGEKGQTRMREIMSSVREQWTLLFGREAVVMLDDYSESEQSDIDGRKLALNLPKSNVVKLWMADGGFIALRPSGTEPKLKIYFSIQDKDKETANGRVVDYLSTVEQAYGLVRENESQS